MSANSGFSLNSRSMGRAMASNREQQRLLNLEEEELSNDRHRTRCHINSKMHQLRAEMYKVRVKTPSLDECLSGVTLCGLGSGQSPAPVSSYYEIGKNGRLAKKRAAKRPTGQAKNAAASRQRPKRALSPPASDMHEKIASFFERNRELFTPARWEHEGSRSAQSFAGEGEPGGQEADRSHTASFGASFRYAPPETARSPSGTSATDHDGPPGSAQNARKNVTSANPYQSFFKPDSASLRLAQQMVVVSRKLKSIQVRREEMAREYRVVAKRASAKPKSKMKAAPSVNTKKVQTDKDTNEAN